MRQIVIEFTDDEAKYVQSFLRRKYSKDKKIGINELCEIAIRKEVAEQAEATF
jgi:hypothetical protein